MYVGLSVRTKSIYVDIFKNILNEEPLWNPNFLFANTEPNLNEAIRECFPTCKIVHSWLHLAQVICSTIYIIYCYLIINNMEENFIKFHISGIKKRNKSFKSA